MKKRIGWQKYEDVIEQNISSPILQSILAQMSEFINEQQEAEEQEDEYEAQQSSVTSTIPLTQQLIEDITMLSHFECWMGYTNFDITKKIRDKLNKIEGVELLKICSRYRFFIGVGRMFKFPEVRKNIEKELTSGE